MDLVTVAIHRKFQMLAPSMNERTKRHWTGTEAEAIVKGGITMVAGAAGLAHTTIRRGITEAAEQAENPDAAMARLLIVPSNFHGVWYYTVKPQRKRI